MGGRLLRGWLLRPLVALERIQDRLDAVEEFAFRAHRTGEAARDAEDAARHGTARRPRRARHRRARATWSSLRQSIAAIPRVRLLLDGVAGAARPQPGRRARRSRATSATSSNATLADEPPALARDGGAIRDGIDAELDDLRTISRSGKQHIAEMEEAERARTGISSLKIRYNRVFGYYIEVSKSNLGARAGRLPPQADDCRRRALHHAGAEGVRGEGRSAPTSASSSARSRSSRPCAARVAAEAPRVQDTARGLAALDVLASLAETAAAHNYTKPLMHAGDELVATDVAPSRSSSGTSAGAFVPNDVTLDAPRIS